MDEHEQNIKEAVSKMSEHEQNIKEALSNLTREQIRDLVDAISELSYSMSKFAIENIPVVNEQGREARDELIECCEYHEKTSTLMSVN